MGRTPSGEYDGTVHLTSPAFDHGAPIPAIYTCDGGDRRPPLAWTDPPDGTQTFALTMIDPDVPPQIRPDGRWVHWLTWNLPADCRALPEDAPVPGEEGVGTSGDIGYHGPCPPDREHRYFFTLYALDAPLVLPPGADEAALRAAMEPHILDRTELMGRYNRIRI